MRSLRPLRFVGPALLAVCLGITLVGDPANSTLALVQVGLLLVGGVLVTGAAFRNPVRANLGWRPLLGVGEVSIGVVVPLGVLGTGLDTASSEFYGLVAAVAGIGLLVVIGSQVLPHRS